MPASYLNRFVKCDSTEVVYRGLLYKPKLHLPHAIYSILKSYLAVRHFYVKLQDARTTLYPLLSGVPQGSVLGPRLYLIYTADIPTTRVTEMATFADDTAILASHVDPISTSRNLQIHLLNLQTWFRKWRLKSKWNQVGTCYLHPETGCLSPSNT
jgi:hypothetical protein